MTDSVFRLSAIGEANADHRVHAKAKSRKHSVRLSAAGGYSAHGAGLFRAPELPPFEEGHGPPGSPSGPSTSANELALPATSSLRRAPTEQRGHGFHVRVFFHRRRSSESIQALAICDPRPGRIAEATSENALAAAAESLPESLVVVVAGDGDVLVTLLKALGPVEALEPR